MRTTTTAAAPSSLFYDYDNQAWVRDGLYINCGHRGTLRASGRCCFGGAHVGERASDHLSPARLAELKGTPQPDRD